ncbi:hypothetical protein PGT21_012892 [Puccinia graminis f. sp. tritici]|uniref:Uncharacterized protein n=1 Tax=Puccinia graminis f. sp. tritici TaxID=56615 RepID=A0A5B0QI76_PUCGR|nr:hypothetical protein PGT21_012892 [Puccinia graminis f. sp. tritici]
MDARRPSPNQLRTQLGAKRRGLGPQSTRARGSDPTSTEYRGPPPQQTNRNTSFDGALGRPAESPQPYNRRKPSALQENFHYKPACGSSLPNRTSELRLRKPPCDENAVRPKEPSYYPQNERASDPRMNSARPRVQQPPSRDTKARRSSQAQYGAEDSQAGLKLVPSTDYPVEGNNFRKSEENFGGEDHSRIHSRSDSDSSNEYEYSPSRDSRAGDTASASRIIHPGAINTFNQLTAPAARIPTADRSSLVSLVTDFPIDQLENDTDIEPRMADTGGNKSPAVSEDHRETKISKRSVPFSKSGVRKRQFISPPSSYLAPSSSKTQEEAASINDLLSVVGEKNRTLVEDLDHAVKENQTLRNQIDMNEIEKRRSRESLKKLTTKIVTEKEKLDENFGEMKFQLRDRFALEKRQSEISSQEIGCLRKEIHESLEGIHVDEILEPGCLYAGLQDARQAINVAKEIDEDRKKKQMVIDILRKEVTEMSQRILELENLNGHQSIHMSRMEESWKEKSQNIQITVQKKAELILGRLDEKSYFEEEKLHNTIQVLEKQLFSQKQEFAELCKDFEAARLKLEQTEQSLEIEQQDNDLSRTEAKRRLLEELTSRLAKENIKLEESKSKIDTDNTSLKNQYVTLSEDLSCHQKLLVQANQNADSLNSRLQDQESVILGLRACEAANKSNNVDLGVLKLRIEQLEEKNLALENQNACTNLTLSECHLKIEDLESKEKEMIRISTQDSNSARQLHHETLDLKETIRKVGANLEDVKQENNALRKDISSKEGQLIIAAGLEAQLKEKVQGLLKAVEQHGNNNKDLQSRLDCTQTKWEDSKSRENLLMGQAKILRENFNEAQATQSVLNREIDELRKQVADLVAKHSEAQMVGELRLSKEAIDRLNETVNQQIKKREEVDQLQNERLEIERRYINILEDTKSLNGLVGKHEKEEASLQASLKKAQEELERSKIEMMNLKTSHAVQVSTAADILHETEKQASESRKQAASAAREKAVATLERKYETMLMNANNEKKRLAKQLGDSESRLLAISAELAKSKGKPSLEECFSSSEHNDPTSLPLASKIEESSSTKKRKVNTFLSTYFALREKNVKVD